jgi:ArsR family transcriptional regulator, arsenate/arsenite/antimonite-responsive transcriptional repressor
VLLIRIGQLKAWCDTRGLSYASRMDNQSAVMALGALAQDTRLATVELLARLAPAGLPAGEIARKLGVPPNTMSTHLAILVRGGILVSQRESRVIRYRANLELVEDVREFLMRLPQQSECGDASI